MIIYIVVWLFLPFIVYAGYKFNFKFSLIIVLLGICLSFFSIPFGFKHSWILVLLQNLTFILSILFVKQQEKIKELNKRRPEKTLKELKISHDSFKNSYNEILSKKKTITGKMVKITDLYKISKEIERTLEFDKIIDIFKVGFLNVLHFNKFILFILDEEKKSHICNGIDINFLNELKKEYLHPFLPIDYKNGAIIRTPLYFSEKLLGEIFIYEGNFKKFSKENLESIKIFAYQMSLGIGRALLFEKILELSRIDGLTGLIRRNYFMQRFKEELDRATRYDLPLTFLMTDIDHFKKINDVYGHQTGDEILKGIADAIKSSVYDTDIIGRYGGEEFSIIMPQAKKEGALQKAQDIRRTIKEKEFEIEGKNISVTISIGVAYFPEDAKTIKELIAKADEALYRAKESGRDKIIEFSRPQQ